MNNSFKYLFLTFFLITNSLIAGEGGVDVGNFSKVKIPGTNIIYKAPINWKVTSNNNISIVTSPSNSIIKSGLANFGKNQLSTSQEILDYLNENSDKKYKLKSINNLDVVSHSSKDFLTRELFIVSPTKEIAHIEVKAKEKDINLTNITLGKIFFEYQGVATENSKDNTVELNLNYRESCVNFSIGNSEAGCNGAYVVSGQYIHHNKKDLLKIGAGGYDTGKIIDLEIEASDYKKISIKDKYLVLPNTKVRLEQIYSKFSPDTPITRLDSIELKEGHTYLIRTISWPEEDMLFKMKVNKLISNKSVNITFNKLASVPKKTLQKYVNYMNKYTQDVEMKRVEGIVKLYDRVKWSGGYAQATFNFFFGTRDNQFITGNGWDLLFDSGRPGSFDFAGSWSDRGQIFDKGKIGLKKITIDSFPDPKSISSGDSVDAQLGHTYLLMGYNVGDEGYTVWSAFEVLEIEPEQKRWVKIKWKKFKITTPSEDPFIHKSVLTNTDIKSSFVKKEIFDSLDYFYPFADFYKKEKYCTISLNIYDEYISFGQDIMGQYYEFDGSLKSIKLVDVNPSKLKTSSIHGYESSIYEYKLNQVYIFKLKSYWEEYILALEIKKKDKHKIYFNYKILDLKLATPGFCAVP